MEVTKSRAKPLLMALESLESAVEEWQSGRQMDDPSQPHLPGLATTQRLLSAGDPVAKPPPPQELERTRELLSQLKDQIRQLSEK